MSAPADRHEPADPTTPIGDHALLADLHTGPLVSREGSIDWLCLPRFDSPSVFSHLLGDPDRSRWLLRPVDGTVTGRSYDEDTFVLRTHWQTRTGSCVVTEFMPLGDGRADLVRTVECTGGEVELETELVIRYGYGTILPWVRRTTTPDGVPVLTFSAGPDAIAVSGPGLRAAPRESAASTHPRRHSHAGRHRLRSGQTQSWVLTWYPSHHAVPPALDVAAALRSCTDHWQSWASQVHTEGPYGELVRRSLLVLRGLTHASTGGIVAAPTTSLPESFGGERNWDYRFCWLRDSALTLQAMLAHGLTEGAQHWRDWLLRAVAGDPADLQIMYGIAGERELPERELPHLAGYAGSRPVRIGNGAVTQFQADVVGEVMIALAELRDAGVAEDDFSWPLQVNLLRFCEDHLDTPDQGLWEMRGEPRFFTHSRVMTWAAFDAGIRAVEQYGLAGPVATWRRMREQLAAEIEQEGFDRATNSYRQAYGSDEVDASLLQLPHTGYLAADDPRMLGTVARIEAQLVDGDGLPARYRTTAGADGLATDGLAGDEHPFLACSFWLVEQYARSGRRDDAVRLMDRLAEAATELGLYAEEYDPVGRRHVGNFPQAFSHLALVGAADALTDTSR